MQADEHEPDEQPEVGAGRMLDGLGDDEADQEGNEG
jgi:hypothetical protein